MREDDAVDVRAVTYAELEADFDGDGWLVWWTPDRADPGGRIVIGVGDTIDAACADAADLLLAALQAVYACREA